MKFYVHTFGCQMNTADSEEMGRHLAGRGFSKTASQEEADWILVNTCTVRQHAEDKAMSYIGRLRTWKSQGPDRRLVISGCAAENLREAIRRKFSHVDLVVGAKSIGRFAEMVRPLLKEASCEADEFSDPWSVDNRYPLDLNDSSSAFVTIMRGCNYSCSYCIVPQVRGKEIYRPAESILEEVRQKAEQGAREVMLLGQTVNSYRPSHAGGPRDFSDLLRLVNEVPGIRRIRFMSPHPYYLNDRLARAMGECGNVCPHMHLPAQSGSNAMLKAMRRNYTREEFIQKVGRLRRERPGISITTDLIVGFPGETEEDFNATLSMIEHTDMDGAFCFKYSPRPGTESSRLADDVPREVKEERLSRLLELTHRQSARKVGSLLGSVQDVLVTKDGPGGDYEGLSPASWSIRFTSAAPRRKGEIVPVTVTRVSGRSLHGAA